MRKVLLLGLLSLGMATMALARQHGTVAPAVLPPAIHPMPVALVSESHVVPLHASSQVRPGVHVAPTGMRPVVSHRPVGRPVHPQPPSPRGGPFTWNSSCAGAPFLNDSYPAPGLGFNYTNFPGVHPNWGACNPVTGVVLPFFGGGVYQPVPYDVDSTQQEEAQDNTANEQSESDLQPDTEEQSGSASSRSSSDSNSPSEPVPEFVFVKRDGSTLFAVAYSLLKDKIRYVTKEGLRRSVTLDSLDFEATQKFNEERGNTINLPAPLASGIALAIPPLPLR